MSVVSYINDRLQNVVANLGTDRDKAAHSFYGDNYLTDDQLITAYRFAWLPRKIVDIPALDACRKWRNWQADGSDISKIEAVEKQLGVQRKTLDALKKARLFGGAAIYIGTTDRDPAKPMRETATLTHLTVMTRRQLKAGDLAQDPQSDRYGKPAFYTVGNTQQRIDPSRLAIFTGSPLPDDELAMGDEYGWGDSVLAAPYSAIQNADSSAANVASLIFEAKVDVFKIPDLMQKVSDPEYESALLKRLSLAGRGKSINGALLMDANEDYEQKNASFGSLNEILMTFMQVVSGAADIPMTRLFGQSAGGLDATGDNDIRNYYDRVNSEQELEIEPALAGLDELIIRNALGSRPADVWFSWASLWQASSSELATIGKTNAETISELAATRLIPDDALSQAAVTMMTESGAMPGLESAVDDSAMEIGGDDPGDDMGSAV
jgi:hypothetical protein